MKATRAPEAEAALLASLIAAPALAGVSIDGRPVTDSNWAAQNIYFAETTFTGDDHGMGTRNDEFTITIVIIIRNTGTPASVKARAWELVLAIGDVIYADRTLGGVLNQNSEITEGTVSVYPAGTQAEGSPWESEARLSVRGEALIVNQ
jgi:hypothetical protein